jgi:hypothetical protein
MIEDIARALGRDGVRWLRGEKISAGENRRGNRIYMKPPEMKKKERERLVKKIERELKMQEMSKKVTVIEFKKNGNSKRKRPSLR